MPITGTEQVTADNAGRPRGWTLPPLEADAAQLHLDWQAPPMLHD